MAEKRAWNPSAASSAASTDTSGGSAVFSASAARSAVRPPSRSRSRPDRSRARPCRSARRPRARPTPRVDDVERLPQRSLDRALAGLARPAVEPAAVVLECEPERPHGRSFYHALGRPRARLDLEHEPVDGADDDRHAGVDGLASRARSRSRRRRGPGPARRGGVVETGERDPGAADDRLGPDGAGPPARRRRDQATITRRLARCRRTTAPTTSHTFHGDGRRARLPRAR